MNERRPVAAVNDDSRHRRALVVIVVCGALLRLFHLGHQSLWVDELMTLEVATPKPGYPIWQLLLHNIHGPLHTFVVFLFRSAGEADGWLRLPSALAGVAAIPLLFRWLRPRFGARAALWGALLLAVNPLHVHYSQELRNYAFVMCFVLAASVQVDRLAAAWSRRRALLLSALVAASVLSNFSATFTFLAQTIAYFRGAGSSRRSLVRWGVVTGIVVLLVSPWIYRVTTFVDFGRLTTPVLPGELDPGERLRGDTTFRLESIPYTAYTYSVGFALGPSLRELHDDASLRAVLKKHAPVIAWVALVFTLVGVVGLRAVRRARGWGDVLELAAYIVIPLAATLALNWQNAKAFNVRYVLVGLPAFLAFLAAGAGSLRGARRGIAVALLATCAASLANHYFNPRFVKEDVRGALAEVERSLQPGECIFAPTVWQLVEHYRKVEAPLYRVSAAHPQSTARRLEDLLNDCTTFWYLRARPWVDDPDGRVRVAIESRCDALERFETPGVEVTRYRLRQPDTPR